MRKLKCGLIGCGWVADWKHLPFLCSSPDVELVAICDELPERMESAAQKFQLTNVKKYRDYHELCADPEIEVVHICTPNALHYEMAMAAIAGKKHVFCEKPLTTNSKDAISMVEAAKAAGVKLTIGHQRRFFSKVQFVHQLVQDGTLGEIYFAKALDARRRGVPTWGDYMKKARNGGGVLFDGAPHSLDMTMYLMDNFRPVSVRGVTLDKMRYEFGGNTWGRWDAEHCDVEDTGFALITMENGATIYLEAAWLINMLGMSSASTIVGNKGGADMGGPGGAVRVNQIVADKMVTFSPEFKIIAGGEPYIGEAEANDVQLQDWVDAIREDRDPFIKGEEGIPVVQIIEAIYESNRTGEVAHITPYNG